MSISIEELFNNTTELDEKSVSYLVKAIKSNNIEGFDYLEFKHSMNSLQSMGMEEDTAIKSAFTTASTMGLTEEKLMNSAEHYQNILNEEKGKFSQALKKQVTNRIERKRKQMDELHSKIGEIERKIEELKEKKSEFEKLIQKAEKDVDQAEKKINSAQDKFERAYNAFNDEIQSDIVKFKETIKS